MKYYKQTPSACLAYSFLQLGRVKEDAVKEYEEAMVNGRPNPRGVRSWVAKYAPEALQEITEYYDTGVLRQVPLPSDGTAVLGVVFGWGYAWSGHAVSFDSGTILDPDGPGVPETWEEFKERFKLKGAEPIRLAAVMPAKLPEKR